MYSRYNYPYITEYSYPSNIITTPTSASTNNSTQSDDRIFPFAFPFLLGGVTGAAIAPAFWNNGYGGRPCCYPQPMPYQYNNYYYPPYYRSK